MLCGLMTPDEGEGKCLGYSIKKHTADLKRLVGYVPQSFSLYQDLTVKENLEFIARVYEESDWNEPKPDWKIFCAIVSDIPGINIRLKIDSAVRAEVADTEMMSSFQPVNLAASLTF